MVLNILEPKLFDNKQISFIEIDAKGNIIIQEIEGNSSLINCNNEGEFYKFICLANEKLLIEVKQLLKNSLNTDASILLLLDRNIELIPEVKEGKRGIYYRINQLEEFIKEINTDQIDNLIVEEEKHLALEIDFTDLIRAIKFGNCVLFLGPEISIDENGKSLHQKFCETASNYKRKYYTADGFFMPGAETRLVNVAKDYYSRQFHVENIIANSVLSKLAQIPFNLIVSVAPDDAMHRIFRKLNVNHHFLYYTGTKHKNINVNNKIPIIYNALGAASQNGRYIFTHRQFYEYLKVDVETKFPLEIESNIRSEKTTHNLFLGFDFNKWSTKMLMYQLNLVFESESYAFDADKIEELNKEFINQQFNVSFIDASYRTFIDTLLKKSQEAGITLNLKNHFVNESLNELMNLKHKTIESFDVNELLRIEDSIKVIENKIIENK
jgi:hypothetical protein